MILVHRLNPARTTVPHVGLQHSQHLHHSRNLASLSLHLCIVLSTIVKSKERNKKKKTSTADLLIKYNRLIKNLPQSNMALIWLHFLRMSLAKEVHPRNY